MRYDLIKKYKNNEYDKFFANIKKLNDEEFDEIYHRYDNDDFRSNNFRGRTFIKKKGYKEKGDYIFPNTVQWDRGSIAYMAWRNPRKDDLPNFITAYIIWQNKDGKQHREHGPAEISSTTNHVAWYRHGKQYFPKEEILEWVRQDIEYLEDSEEYEFQKICLENNPSLVTILKKPHKKIKEEFSAYLDLGNIGL